MTNNNHTSTFGEFREAELNATNRLINRFIEAAKLDIIKYCSDEKPINQFGEVRDYHCINENGKNKLRALKIEIQNFKTDFYASKSCQTIATRINEDPELVYKYVLKRIFSKDGLFFYGGPCSFREYDDFNLESEVFELSSYQILRDIQMDRWYNFLRNDKSK